MAKYLGFYDECGIIALLKAARKHGAENVGVRGVDWGSETFSATDEDGVIDLLDCADIYWAFSFSDKDGEHLGTFYIVLGNDDGSVVYDSSCQEWCDKVWDAIA